MSRFPSWFSGDRALFSLSHPARNSVLLIKPLRRSNGEGLARGESRGGDRDEYERDEEEEVQRIEERGDNRAV